MKKFLTLFIAAVMLLGIAGCTTEDNPQTAGNSPLAGQKVAYIMQMAESDIFQMWADAAEQTAEGLGMEFTAFFCDGSDEQWREIISQCAAEGYNGLLLSHGGQDYAYSFLTELLQQYPELKIVTFDTLFTDENGQRQKIDGVTQIFQQDAQLAELSLDYICNTLYADKAASGAAVNVLKVWAGPNYLAAFDRRQEGYSSFEQQGLINTVATIAPTDYQDAESSMAEIAAAALTQYQDGEIDAIWCCYDLYASGVYTALTEGGYDIPMVSVDICNDDIAKMAEEGSPWKACATTNWDYNGEFAMRVLALEMAGEYDKIIDPMSGAVSDWLELPANLVTQEMVAGGSVTVSNLDSTAGAQYSDRSWMPTTTWMAELLGD